MEHLSGLDHLLKIAARFWPVWIAMAVVLVPSVATRRRTGLYGQIFESGIGTVGFSMVLFWVMTAIFADVIMTHDPYSTWGGLKNALPGTALRDPGEGVYPYALMGGDNLARDVFSRMVA
ncbi:MAG: ABC transporter permease, partial [Albidovulum sp.]